MAGSLKPNVDGLGNEVIATNITFHSTINGSLFDGNNTDSFYFMDNINDFVQFTIDKPINIWALSVTDSGHAADYNTTLKIIEINSDSTTTDITSQITQYTGATAPSTWKKCICKLPAGTYKLTRAGASYGRLDAEWYLEESSSSSVIVPTNLTATAGDTQVTLNWVAVTGATGYNVKRATTAGGPYETIASNVSGTSYVDTDVVNGTTYYYVVTAVTADGESGNSNEASATPKAVVTPPTTENALLRVTMIDSSEREYKLPKTEIDGFISWFTRTVGTGTSVYQLNKVMTNSKDYLVYDKIISFEVIPVA